MVESVGQPQALAARERTDRPRTMVVVVLVVVAFVAGCRTGRGWGRLMGY